MYAILQKTTFFYKTLLFYLTFVEKSITMIFENMCFYSYVGK